MTKISQTKIGQSVVDLANQVAKADATKPARSTQVQSGGDKFAGQGQATVLQLKAKLDEVRNLLGQEAVNEILGDLPKAALDALKSVNSELKIEAGQSPYLAYKKAYADLLKLETKAQAAHGTLATAAHGHGKASLAYDSGELTDNGKHMSTMQSFASKEEFEKANAKASPQQLATWISDARATTQAINDKIKAALPDVPNSYLLAGPFLEGPGEMSATRMAKSCERYSEQRAYPPRDMATVRTMVPGYSDTAKQVAQLEAHLRDKAFPSAKEIALLKAELHDDSVTVKDLFSEAKTLIAEIEGMADKSEIKREIRSSGKASGSGVAVTYKDMGDVMASTGMTVGHSSSRASGTSETLNVTARAYTMVQTPNNLLYLKLDELKGHNTISPLETSIMMERLLTVRRLYEAMQTREPESAFTGALKGWMEESTFTFGNSSVKMSDLRADLIALANQGVYPSERLDIVKEELNLGPSRTKGKLSGLKSLSDL